jgi:hypothetical protein
MTKLTVDTLTYEQVIEILEEEMEEYERDSPYKELDFNAPCNEKS